MNVNDPVVKEALEKARNLPEDEETLKKIPTDLPARLKFAIFIYKLLKYTLILLIIITVILFFVNILLRF